MQVSKYLKSFLGVLAISLFCVLPSQKVFADTNQPTQEQYDKIYNYLVSASSEPLLLDSSYSNKSFSYKFKNTRIGKLETNAYLLSYATDSGFASTIPKNIALDINSFLDEISFTFNVISSDGLNFYFKPTDNDKNILINYLSLNKQTSRPGISEPEPEPDSKPEIIHTDNPVKLIIDSIINAFKSLKGYGINILIMAISLGTIFIGGSWLWGKAKTWLKNS